jgi:hypothetical protein
MKRVLFSLLLSLFYLTFFGQTESENFKIENGSLYWQKVYQKDSLMNVIDLYMNAGNLTGDLKPFEADFKGAGYSEMKIPMYVPRTEIHGIISIETKKDRYRITIKDIKLVQSYDDGLSKKGDETALSFFAIKDNTSFRPNFLKSAIIIYNFTFQKRLTLSINNDSW